MSPDVAIWRLLLPISLLGVANGFMWAPIGSTATRNLPIRQAGAGAGVYNTTRQVGAVLGSAAIAALMQSRLVAELPGGAGRRTGAMSPGMHLPAPLRDGFASAMAHSLLLPAAVSVIGLVAVLLFAAPRHLQRQAPPAPEPVIAS